MRLVIAQQRVRILTKIDPFDIQTHTILFLLVYSRFICTLYSGRYTYNNHRIGMTSKPKGKEAKSMHTEDFTQANEVQQLLGRLRSTCEGKQFSDVIDDQGNQYVDLVMEGGGVLGVALVGYTYVLEEMGLRFLRVGGTSAGSINAVLVAGLGTPAQRKSEKIIKELANVTLWDFVDGNSDVRDFVAALVHNSSLLKLGWKAAQVIDTMLWKLGLNPGEEFLEWLSAILERDGVETSRKLLDRMATIPEGLRIRNEGPLVPDQSKPPVSLVAADVSTQTKVDFPRMAPLYYR